MRLLTQKFCYIGLLIGLCNLSAAASAAGSPEQKAALGTLDQFMVAFNAMDMQAWADTLHFPHIRIASGQVSILKSAEAFQARKVFDSLKKPAGLALNGSIEPLHYPRPIKSISRPFLSDWTPTAPPSVAISHSTSSPSGMAAGESRHDLVLRRETTQPLSNLNLGTQP